MSNINHVGVVRSNGRKCVVVYRTLPGDAYNCVIIPTEALPDTYHDSLMRVVESNAGQSASQLSEVLYRSTFPDGSIMLTSLVTKGFTAKMPTDAIEMVPNPSTSISLAELNQQIAQIQGVSVHDLAIAPDVTDANTTEVAQVHEMKTTPIDEQPLSDEQLATKYRNDAAQLLAEVERLHKMADELSPKPTIQSETVVESSSDTPSSDIVHESVVEESKSNIAANRRRSK